MWKDGHVKMGRGSHVGVGGFIDYVYDPIPVRFLALDQASGEAVRVDYGTFTGNV